MADFLQALDVLLSWEGGYAKVKRDPGGETYCGISRINFPQWSGWPVVDNYKRTWPIKWNEFIPVTGLVAMVEDFYQSRFWDNQDYKDIANQDITSKVFQHNVNLGQRGVKLAQETTLTLNLENGISFSDSGITVDGGLGPKTVAALNKLDADKFLTTYCAAVQSYYAALIHEHPQLGIFQKEWFLRANTIGKRPA